MKSDPFTDSGTTEGCEDDTWFGSGHYVLLETTVGQKHFLLSGTSVALDIRDDIGVEDSDETYLLCKDSDGYIKNCPSGTAASASETKTQGLFFREIQ